ncbi:MAG TPA: DUF4286 family protein [Arachidicoccus sp.]
MYLYNITIKVDWSIHDDWLRWMNEEHIAQILSYNNFHRYSLYKILNIDESDGPTYALQLFAESKALYNSFIEIHLHSINQIQKEHWGSKMLSFSTLMEIVY